MRALGAGDLVRQPQPKAGAARRPRPRFEDGRIDTSKPAHAVFTFVGGCAERYSLFAEVAGDRFFVRRAVSYDPDATLDPSGLQATDVTSRECPAHTPRHAPPAWSMVAPTGHHH